MTNTEIIQAIRNEIERLKTVQLKRIQEGDLVDAEPYDKIEAYNELLSFLSTLESEKPMNQEVLEEEILNQWEDYPHDKWPKCPYHDFANIARHFAKWGAEHLATSGKTLEIKPGDEVTINGHKIVYDKDKGYVTIVKSEELVPNDPNQAAVNWICSHKNGEVLYVKDAFIAGAKWQAEQLLKSSPLPEDTVLFNKGVEEGKRLTMEEAVNERWDELQTNFREINEAFEAGKKEQKEQMLKEAVEGTVYGNGDYTWVAGDIPSQFKYGDKVRIIIVKEELGFIKMWFEDIRDYALTKRNANGYLLSDSRVLTEIAVKAKDASEYVDLLLKEDEK